MKSFVLAISGLFIIVLSVSALADTFFQSDFMKPDIAEKKWGIKSLEKDLFKKLASRFYTGRKLGKRQRSEAS
jgi:hypothetical protein